MNKITKLTMLTIAASLIAACSKAPEVKTAKIKAIYSEKYEIVSVDQPKHFYVDLRHIETGHVFKRTARSKHCNRWRDYPVGTMIWADTYHYEDGTFAVSSNSANRAICG